MKPNWDDLGGRDSDFDKLLFWHDCTEECRLCAGCGDERTRDAAVQWLLSKGFMAIVCGGVYAVVDFEQDDVPVGDGDTLEAALFAACRTVLDMKVGA